MSPKNIAALVNGMSFKELGDLISKFDLPEEHHLTVGRLIIDVYHEPTILDWLGITKDYEIDELDDRKIRAFSLRVLQGRNFVY